MVAKSEGKWRARPGKISEEYKSWINYHWVWMAARLNEYEEKNVWQEREWLKVRRKAEAE